MHTERQFPPRTRTQNQTRLGQVLEVPLGHGDRRGDGELSRGLASDLHILSELSSLALDLDVVDEELLVRSGVKLFRGAKLQRSAAVPPSHAHPPRL